MTMRGQKAILFSVIILLLLLMAIMSFSRSNKFDGAFLSNANIANAVMGMAIIALCAVAWRRRVISGAVLTVFLVLSVSLFFARFIPL